MILNSVIRATEDVDILIEGLSNLADGAARELTPEDFVENVVVKIADEVIDNVRIPYLSLEDLIRSKLTHRDQDRVDVERLGRLR